MRNPEVADHRRRELKQFRRSRLERTNGKRFFGRRNGDGGGGGGNIVALVVLILLVGGLASVYSVGRTLLRNAQAGNNAATSAGTSSRIAALSTQEIATPQATPAKVAFVVKAGDTWSDVATRLQAQGIITSAFTFKPPLRVVGTDGSLEPGTYPLHSGMTDDEIMNVLEHAAPPKQASVLFVEGWRMEQDAAQLQTQGVVSASDFLSVTKSPNLSVNGVNYNFLADRPAGATLEGYLFPDTYDFFLNTSAQDVVEKMLDRFGQEVTPQMQAQAQQEGHTLYQVLIVASIVEREAQLDSERPLIAGVYWNRLKLGQCMCADPTVQYALGNASNWWPVLNTAARMLAPDSPFNTYTHRGFPPAPICNPGLASIEAALNPQGDYLYFVAKGDGTHLFSHTLQEQTANEQRVQQSSSTSAKP